MVVDVASAAALDAIVKLWRRADVVAMKLGAACRVKIQVRGREKRLVVPKSSMTQRRDTRTGIWNVATRRVKLHHDFSKGFLLYLPTQLLNTTKSPAQQSQSWHPSRRKNQR